MNEEFISIAEAMRLTGESDVRLMRALKDALEASDIPLESILRKEQREKGMMYLLNKEFLLKALEGEPIEPGETELQEEAELQAEEVGQERSAASEPESSRQVLKGKDEMIQVLQDVIETKDKHIEDLSKKIDQLIERDRETNFLLKGLQDRIFLLERGTEKKNARQ
ncbi:MAG: hypothetical protein Q8P03_00530 [bacterium]|nr:hypothetical protein [bacterium]